MSAIRVTNVHPHCIELVVVFLRAALGALAIAVGLIAAAILRIVQFLGPRPPAAARTVVHVPEVRPVGAARRCA
jgi:hypothetical protein